MGAVLQLTDTVISVTPVVAQSAETCFFQGSEMKTRPKEVNRGQQRCTLLIIIFQILVQLKSK